MKIQKVSICNFRNFSDYSINFTDGFQTLIGENNIGKSNFYRAVRLVLDKSLSFNDRYLAESDFHGFPELTIDSHVIISVEFSGDNLATYPNLHALKCSETTARVTYLYAHKSKLYDTGETYETIEIKDFQHRLYGGGDSLSLDDLVKLNEIGLKDLAGINVHYITGFRNIQSDLHGKNQSLLSQYCQSGDETEENLKSVTGILEKSSKDLNKLDFIPIISESITTQTQEIAGNHFSYPISLSFLSKHDANSWNSLNLFFTPDGGSDEPIGLLGLGQKNILYLSLFLGRLMNESSDSELHILLIEEPEAHLHPQLQKFLFSNLGALDHTQIFMTSHSTHIASDCEYKNLNVMYKNAEGATASFSPFAQDRLSARDSLLLKRYLDATRSELFFASKLVLVEGVAEQFIIPAIAKKMFGINLTEHNISVIPIHSRYFDPYLKLFQDDGMKIPVVAIIDGDKKEIKEDEPYTTAVANAKALEVDSRVAVFNGNQTLELDLFPNKETNYEILKACFDNLGHSTSFSNFEQKIGNDEDAWNEELISRIDGTVKKGRFAQELAILLDGNFTIPSYIGEALEFIIHK